MISTKILENFEEKYLSDKENLVIQNAIARVGIKESSISQEVLRKHKFVFSDEIETGKITNQKQSGRCWLFSGLNSIRPGVMKKLNVEQFEFSQSYLQFYDKIEKANTYLENILKTRKLDILDRLVQHVIKSPAEDGGWWKFFSGLVKKYGVIPKECMPETYHSSNTAVLNEMLDLRLKRAAMRIRASKSEKEAKKIKEEALYEVYNICVKALGMPPKLVDFEYMDKDKKYHRISGITPKQFMKKYVKDDIAGKIQLVADPRTSNEVGRVYELPYTMSITEDGPVHYLNVPMEEMKMATMKSIKAGSPVWFGCDVGKDSDSKSGIMDTNIFDYDAILTELGEFSREDRLLSTAAVVSHAMVFVGVDINEDGKPCMWKVENSWGDKTGKDGFFSMSDEWFENHNYEVIVDKKYVSDEFLKGFDKEVIKLPYYDVY